jgi:hypothetical protein
MYLQVCVGEEKERNTHARSLASLRRAGRWARVHDVHVNSPPKSGPKPHSPAASFYHLVLLQVCV